MNKPHLTRRYGRWVVTIKAGANMPAYLHAAICWADWKNGRGYFAGRK